MIYLIFFILFVLLVIYTLYQYRIILKLKKQIKATNIKMSKLQYYYRIVNVWISLKQKNKKIYTYLEKMKYRKVAIYGFSELGINLFEDLKDTTIEIVCVIDRNVDKVIGLADCYMPDEKLPDFDVLIVTVMADYNEINNVMKKRVRCPIISLEDILLETAM